eukprot:m.174935 g.174935  ORF g.174935 m.174935 type:complete len:258 (-) comp21344_c2_seq1:33-806(-)
MLSSLCAPLSGRGRSRTGDCHAFLYLLLTRHRAKLAAADREESAAAWGQRVDAQFAKLEADAAAVQPWKQLLLGMCHSKGIGSVPKNARKATKWFHKAADAGIPAAQVSLGIAYEYGHGTVQNASKAAGYYRKAADQGFCNGQYFLALCYKSGTGVVQDAAQAQHWALLAAEQGHAVAQCTLGGWFKTSKKEDADQQAVLWWRQAAERGYAKAQVQLGQSLEHGKGVERDLAAAVLWYRRAAEQEDPDAVVALAKLK